VRVLCFILCCAVAMINKRWGPNEFKVGAALKSADAEIICLLWNCIYMSVNLIDTIILTHVVFLRYHKNSKINI
jgi:hypothetical protein